MNKFLTLMIIGVLLVTVTPVSPPLQAEMTQGTTVAASQSDDSSSISKVQKAIDDLKANESLEQPIKAALKQEYEQALDALQSASEFTAQAQGFAKTIQSGPARILKWQSELKSVKPSDKTPYAGSTVELQRMLDSQRVSLEQLRKQLSDLTIKITQLEKRPLEIPSRLLEVQRESADIRERLASPELSSDELTVYQTADKTLLQARVKQLTAEKDMLEKEQLSLPIRSDLLRAEQMVLQRQVANNEAALNRLNEELERRLSNMADRLLRVANSVPAGLIQQNKTAETIVSDVRSLAAELESVISEEKHLEELQNQYRDDRENLGVEFASLKEQLELDSNGRAIVQLLFNLDRRCQKTIIRLGQNPVTGLEKSRIGSLHVREKIRAQPELQKQLGPKLSAQLKDLLNARREALEELDRRFAGLTRIQATTEQERQQYLDLAEKIQEYISQTLFGFGPRACPPVSLNTFRTLPESVAWSFQPAHWQEAGRALEALFRKRPVLSLGMLLLSTMILLFRTQIIGALELTGRRNKRISTDRYWNTIQAILWTSLLAVPFPLLLSFSGLAFQQLPEVSDWFAGLQAGVWNATWIVLAVSFMSNVLRSGGLGELHFGWNPSRIKQTRSAILQVSFLYVPALVLTIGSTYGDASIYLSSLGRLSFLLAHLWAMVVVLRLYLITRRTVSNSRSNPSHQSHGRWSWLWFSGLLTVLLSLVAMMVLGYMITSLIWSIGVVVTLLIIGGGSILYGVTLRWFSIRHRRLVLREALEQRRTQQATDDAADGPSEIVEVDAEETSEFSLAMVGEQTRHLVRSCCTLGILISILTYWSQVHSLDDLIGSVTLPLFSGLTLLAVLYAILITVVTLSIVKNLPGFLELIVFRSKNVPAGTRLAIYTLCQYGVIVVGIGAVANVLQVDWVKFGWIVTALSVGIGFGLQEVVANFVSGLILLLERPIRVGDIVTVEATTGTVKNIRLRATTITNWDRQELVVPNRTLITNTLLNWTLSAPLNRIVIPVGIAYGSDTERAREILLAVAAEHPNVLEDPEPMATFEQFADSSLNIVLRAYLPDLEARLLTISELHTEINRRFAEAGIEIAFPQRDLHLRSGWRDFQAMTK